MKTVDKVRTWYQKRKEYYHVQAGLRGILLGWGFCMILLITGFALAAFQIAAREARREKNSAYETMVSYVTGEIEKKCALLSGLAEEAAEIPREHREELVQAFDGADGLAVWENGEITCFPREEALFLGFLESHKGQLTEPGKGQKLLLGTSSSSRYRVGSLQLGWMHSEAEKNIMVSSTLDVSIDPACEFYIYTPDSNTVYPQGYLRPDFSEVKEKLRENYKGKSIRIPSYTVFLQKSSTYGFYGMLCVRNEKLETEFTGYLWLLGAAVCILLILLLGTFAVFKKKVYDPVIHVEHAINGILNGNQGLEVEIDDSSELASAGRAVNSMITHVENLTSREYQSEILKRQAELNALQNQINPHFLYNTLESIRGLALREGSKNAANMTKALANLFRYNIDNRSLTVTLQEELTNIDNYFVIQKYRFSNKIRLVTYIDEENPQLRQYQVPHMVLQPIVENAVCHGLETKRGGGTIVIMVMATESRLIITVSDDGLGMDEKTLERIEEQLQRGYASGRTGERTGIALYNVNERIRILHGEDYGIHVHSTKGIGTEVEVVLPLICQELKS